MHLLQRSMLTTLTVLSFAQLASTMQCADRLHDCAGRRAAGQCQQHRQSMAHWCARTCNTCGGPSPTPPPSSCADRLHDCAGRRAAGQCQQHRQSMAHYCARTCNACGGPSPTPTPSGKCRPLGSVTRSMQNALNVIFLPSGFRGNMARFRQKVQQEIYPRFQRHAAFSSNIPALNFYIVEAEVMANDDGRYCRVNCNGIQRLLCCQLADFARVATRACGSGGVVNTVILHNADHWYGGSGATNGAVLSTHPQSFDIAVHEAGHSLFNLADEYTRSDAGPPSKGNCDTAGCSKWADLIGKWGVGCHAGFCRNGAWHASERNTLMGTFGGRHLGAVNERLACCKYLNVARFEPGFCRKFTGNGLNLRQFCGRNIWRSDRDAGSLLGWLRNESLNSDSVVSETEDMIRRANDDTQGMIYRYIQRPRAFAVKRDSMTGLWTCSEEDDTLEAGLYPQNEVEGDQMADAHLDGETGQSRADDDLIVSAVHEDGRTTRIPYHRYDTLEAPSDPSTNSSGGERLRVPRSYFRAILDTTSPVRTCSVEGQALPLPPGPYASPSASSALSPIPSGANPAPAGVMSGSHMLRHKMLTLMIALAFLVLG